METVKTIIDVITNILAVGFVLLMIAGLAINSNKIKKLEDKIEGIGKVDFTINRNILEKLKEFKNGK